MNNSFNDFNISPELLKGIEEMGFETPTEVQQRGIPHILNKDDMIVMSKTGSGKTAVFGIPMLEMTDPSQPGPQGLILTPTRELAVQVDSNIGQLGKNLGHKTAAVYGQHSINVEVKELEKGVAIITGTPGRVYDHISSGNIVTDNIRFLVLDEADRMLDMGFIDQVVRIIKRLPRERQTLLFSATMPSEIRRICRDYMKNPVTLEVESPTMTVDSIKQIYYRVEKNEKRTQLNRLLSAEQPDSCMIFCNTRRAVDTVQSFLTQQGYSAGSLHGDIPQGKRLRTIERFKNGEFHLLVATDVAARGIHIDDLSLVINYDVPLEKDSYVHRIGRTGRIGNKGHAISLVTGDDIMSLYDIEEHIGAVIEEGELPTEEHLAGLKESADAWRKSKSHPHPERTPQDSRHKPRRSKSGGKPESRTDEGRKEQGGGHEKGRGGSRKRHDGKAEGAPGERRPEERGQKPESKTKHIDPTLENAESAPVTGEKAQGEAKKRRRPRRKPRNPEAIQATEVKSSASAGLSSGEIQSKPKVHDEGKGVKRDSSKAQGEKPGVHQGYQKPSDSAAPAQSAPVVQQKPKDAPSVRPEVTADARMDSSAAKKKSIFKRVIDRVLGK